MNNKDIDDIFKESGLEDISETVLDLALCSYITTTDPEIKTKAIKLICKYVSKIEFRKLLQNNKPINLNIVAPPTKNINYLILDCALTKLVNENHLEVDFSTDKTSYNITKTGIEYKKFLLNSLNDGLELPYIDQLFLRINNGYQSKNNSN